VFAQLRPPVDALEHGHLARACDPCSGKSTLLRTLVTAAALTHTPTEVQFYAVDLGGGTLAGPKVVKPRTFAPHGVERWPAISVACA
jgi:hypothetical protein